MSEEITMAKVSVPSGATERIHAIDWLRVLIVYGIAFYHISLVFSPSRWLVNNHGESLILSGFAGFTFTWGIPAMFLIAGADTWFALRHRTSRYFIRERTLRLVIPLLIGIPLLTPLQQWAMSHNPPPGLGSLPDYYVRFLTHLEPKWPGPFLTAYSYHLWFLGYLFAVSLLALPVLKWLRSPSSQIMRDWIVDKLLRNGGLLILVVPIAATQILLRPRFPDYRDWADIAIYIAVFLYGALLFAEARLRPLLTKTLWYIVPTALISIGVIAAILGFHLDYKLTGPWYIQDAMAIAWSYNTWCWLLVLVGGTLIWLNHANRIVKYLNDLVLPFYVLHHPAVVILASFIVPLGIPMWPKIFLLTASVYGITLFLCETAIRRWAPMRVLFGLKPKAKALAHTPE